MAGFCTNCSNKLQNGSVFCTACGTKNNSSPNRRPTPAPQPIQSAAPTVADPPVSTAGFFGMMLLFSLPVIGWLACLVMAFVPSNQNIKHFARAMLIWLLIALILTGIVAFAVTIMMQSVTPYIDQFTNGLSGELSGFEELGDLGELLEQFASISEMMEGLEQAIPTE